MNSEFIVNTGKIIKEYLETYGISQKDLAIRTNTSEKHISNLIKGKCRLTEEMALKLEFIIPDVPASYWLNYEQKYREYLARFQQEANLSCLDLDSLSKRFHFSEVFKGLDWDINKQANEMLKILGISDFNCFDNVYGNLNAAFMEDGGEKEAMAIWLKLCEEQVDIQNKNIDEIKFSKKDLECSIDTLKGFASIDKMDGILVNCRKLCNKCGVYLVVYPTITNCKIRGALETYMGKPAIFLSGRFKSLDHIWFAFFHELGHLLLHYSASYLAISLEGENTNEENEANTFARNALIDSDSYNKYINSCSQITQDSIVAFARSQNVHPGIIVGRLQHDELIERNQFNKLKVSINVGGS